MKRILFVVNVDWFFLSHRLPIAKAAREAGYEVHIATGRSEQGKSLDSLGFQIHDLTIQRSGKNKLAIIGLCWSLCSVIRKVRPDIIHIVTLQPIVIGGILCRLLFDAPVVFSFSGLGHLFTASGTRMSIKRAFVKILMSAVLGNKIKALIFQNKNDRDLIESLSKEEPVISRIIEGSGVDLSLYTYQRPRAGNFIVTFVSRLLYTKGIREYLEAARIVSRDNPDVQFRVYGDLDYENLACITKSELDEWNTRYNVKYLGFSENVPKILADTNVVCLPSYREGFPKVLCEAAAAGRAVVTTDVPGCRDAVRHGVNGLLVKPKSAPELADAITYLIRNPDMCVEMGMRGRLIAEDLYSIDRIVKIHMAIYNSLIEKAVSCAR